MTVTERLTACFIVIFPSPIHQWEMPDTVLCQKCEATFTMRNVPESDLLNLSLLRSLYVPNNVEVSTIINMVSDADRDIARYDKEIQRLEGLLNELIKQRKELKCHREKTHTLISPIRRLPVEVLEQIFDIACRSEFGIEVTQKSADAYTLELTQVSRGISRASNDRFNSRKRCVPSGGTSYDPSRCCGLLCGLIYLIETEHAV